MITHPIEGGLFRGLAELERTERGWLPHRLPRRAREQCADPQLAAVEAQPSGVRLSFRTRATLIELDVLRTEDGEAVYRRCSTTHHHHLVCRSCGRTVEVEGPTVERWADSVADRHGFTDVSHTLEIFGTCPDC